MTGPDPPLPTQVEADLPPATNPPSDRPTAAAPPFFAPTPRAAAPSPFAGFPEAGEALGDFEMVRVLGSGAFARVYLARQVSLGRMVALKVARAKGREAQTLARLEHPHIVGVFSESVEAGRDLHLLCMQYVPGTTLESVIQALAQLDPPRRDGRAILDAIDAGIHDDTLFDLAAWRERERLAGMDNVEAVCWLGARLAEALAHAHRLDVLHRDIKPANVLLNRYGRPLLADFNVAQMGDEEESFGGTLAYMSPEHLDAFNHEGTDPVDGRSDVYALGLVLYHLYTGEMAFFTPPLQGEVREIVREIAQDRRVGAPTLSQHVPAPASLERVIAKCLADRDARYANADELADDLDACRELHRVRRELPPPRPLTRWALASPLRWAWMFIPLPHVLGSLVNVAYNTTRIHLSNAQHDVFLPIAIVYNLVAYPGCMYLFLRQQWSVFQTWSALARGERPDPETVERMRRQALTLPGWLVGLSCLGWLPGGLFFPLALHAMAGPVPPTVYVHFIVSFTLSGLIAIAYSTILMELLVVRVLYPGLFLDARGLHDKARRELRHEERWLAWLQFLAVLIPIAGAGLMLGVGPEQFTPAYYQGFRVLVTALLAAGMLGLGLAVYTASEVRETVARMTEGGR
jgi:serine/threonine protein kinase